MHSLTIVFGPSPVPWVLLFRDEAKAKAVYASGGLTDEERATGRVGYFSATDDFGQEIRIAKASIHGVMLEDMDQSKLAHVEQGLHRARTQAKAQQMAAADPVLRTAAMAQGPAMLQPGFQGNGAFRGQ